MLNWQIKSIIKIQPRSLQRSDHKVLILLELDFAIIIDIAQFHPGADILRTGVIAFPAQDCVRVAEEAGHIGFGYRIVYGIGVGHVYLPHVHQVLADGLGVGFGFLVGSVFGLVVLLGLGLAC